jgi:hypothetical protein
VTSLAKLTSCDQPTTSALPLDLFTVVVVTVLTRSQLRRKQRQHPISNKDDKRHGVRIKGLRKQTVLKDGPSTGRRSKFRVPLLCGQFANICFDKRASSTEYRPAKRQKQPPAGMEMEKHGKLTRPLFPDRVLGPLLVYNFIVNFYPRH